MRTPIAWKVPIQIAPAVRLRRCSTRPRISRAALFVNVTARTSPGTARPCWISHAIRCVKTRVLPLPAPAKIRSGPSPAVTAARCGGLSPVKRSTPRSVAAGNVAKPKASLVATAAAAHATGGHVIHVVVIRVRPVGRLQGLREGAKELVAQLHGRDLEGILECPVIIGRVTALAGPEEKRDQLHLDRRRESRVGLRASLGL